MIPHTPFQLRDFEMPRYKDAVCLMNLSKICFILNDDDPKFFQESLVLLKNIVDPPPPPPPPKLPNQNTQTGKDLSGAPIPKPPSFNVAICMRCSLRNAILPQRINTDLQQRKYLVCQSCGSNIYI